MKQPKNSENQIKKSKSYTIIESQMLLAQINLMYLVLDFEHSGKDFRSIRLRRNGSELFDFENVWSFKSSEFFTFTQI